MSFLKYTLKRAVSGEVIRRSKKLTAGKILVFLFVILLLLVSLIYLTSRPPETDSVWNTVKPGDSLFSRTTYGISFYRKGRVRLNDGQIAALKYVREDTLEFVLKNSIIEKQLYKNKTTFIGICTGKDSSITHHGEDYSYRWVKIIPFKSFTENPDWNKNQSDILAVGKLSTDWYVRASDITRVNTDSLLIIKQ